MLIAEKKASLNYSPAYIYNITDHKLDIYTKYNIYIALTMLNCIMKSLC